MLHSVPPLWQQELTVRPTISKISASFNVFILAIFWLLPWYQCFGVQSVCYLCLHAVRWVLRKENAKRTMYIKCFFSRRTQLVWLSWCVIGLGLYSVQLILHLRLVSAVGLSTRAGQIANLVYWFCSQCSFNRLHLIVNRAQYKYTLSCVICSRLSKGSIITIF